MVIFVQQFIPYVIPTKLSRGKKLSRLLLWLPCMGCTFSNAKVKHEVKERPHHNDNDEDFMLATTHFIDFLCHAELNALFATKCCSSSCSHPFLRTRIIHVVYHLMEMPFWGYTVIPSKDFEMEIGFHKKLCKNMFFFTIFIYFFIFKSLPEEEVIALS